jgi:outer membrane protein assembly factor BamB
MAAPSPTYYELLGVAVSASTAEIRVAYRNQAKTAHPDAGGDAALFRQILDAYQTLIDDERRRQYDHALGVHRVQVRTDTTAPGNDGFTGDVGFPAWMRGITDDQWNPEDSAERPISTGPVGDGPPIDVVWWSSVRALSLPVAAGALVLVAEADGLRALSAADGEDAWRADLGAPVTSRPIVGDGVVHAVTADGGLHTVELGRGHVLGKLRIDPPAEGNRDEGAVPRVARAVVPAGHGATAELLLWSGPPPRLVAVDPATASARWSAALAAPVSSSVAVVGDTVVVVSGRRTVEAIDTRKGRHHWRVTLRQSVDLAPCASDESSVWLAGAGGAGTLVRLDLATGGVRGSFRLGDAVAGMTAADGLLHVSTAGPPRILAIDGTGSIQLEVRRPRVCPEPAVTDEVLYVADPGGVLVAVDRRRGTVLASRTLPFEPVGPPVPLGDRLVFVAGDGRVWATERL